MKGGLSCLFYIPYSITITIIISGRVLSSSCDRLPPLSSPSPRPSYKTKNNTKAGHEDFTIARHGTSPRPSRWRRSRQDEQQHQQQPRLNISTVAHSFCLSNASCGSLTTLPAMPSLIPRSPKRRLLRLFEPSHVVPLPRRRRKHISHPRGPLLLVVDHLLLLRP